jgi:3-isopropylmalate dehydrogenase
MSDLQDHRIVVLPGDGIGPEVMAEAVACLHMISDHYQLGLEFEEHPIGGAAIDATGSPLPDDTLAACLAADAILLGAVGGPKWSRVAEGPEAGLLQLRSKLGLRANLRPIRATHGLEHHSPLKPDVVCGADILIVRELIGGIYFGKHELSEAEARDECHYRRSDIEQVARIAFEAARQRRGKLTSVDKANVLATSKLWRSTVDAIAKTYPDVSVDHMLVDAAAMELIKQPTAFDVILTENMFGDILSDEASIIAGSIGLLGSSSEGAGPSLFEPIHGSAPDIAGKGVANPAGSIASAVMLLDRGLGLPSCAQQLSHALEAVLSSGQATADLGGRLTCSGFGGAVRELLERAFDCDRATRDLIGSNRGICA